MSTKPELCEDEGCPHHGTDHVCFNSAVALAGITQARTRDEWEARIKQLMADVGFPDSRSLKQAFDQLLQEALPRAWPVTSEDINRIFRGFDMIGPQHAETVREATQALFHLSSEAKGPGDYPTWRDAAVDMRRQLFELKKQGRNTPDDRPATPKADTGSFQGRTGQWVRQCFGSRAASDTVTRRNRFLEEALELVQAAGMSQEDAHALVTYVFDRPRGELEQEVGGALMTLAALCTAHQVDMLECGEQELTRVWDHIPQIRAKEARKPANGPLPGQSDDQA